MSKRKQKRRPDFRKHEAPEKRRAYRRVLRKRLDYWHKTLKPGVQRGLDGDWEMYP